MTPAAASSHRSRAWLSGLAALGLCLACATAGAQPTGNPAGTAPPPADDSAKKPATAQPQRSGVPQSNGRTGPQSTSNSGSSRQGGQNAMAGPREGVVTNPSEPSTRTGGTRQAGSGTSGGLSGRHPGNAQGPSGARYTNQAPAVKP